ncbi:MAG: DNA-processing protein DprA [Pirellulales bacterium]|nr:DNA-processing protein DprA [Pirellulales bacterium]
MQTLDQHFIDTLRLALVPGVGPRLRQALLERFETPSRVLAAAPSDLRAVQGIGPKLANSIVAASDSTEAEAQIELCAANDVTILVADDLAYPRALKEIHDPPAVLFVRGELTSDDALATAIVGSRHATQYGKTQAERLGGSLARAGLTVVSGLARGVDAAAHRGALAAGGRTIAVLGSGVLNIYPPEHVELADEICERGAVISEMPPTFAPIGGSFPQRNRIITGLSLGLIVVEAAERSGALISARHAMEQGREVFAVPGRIDSRMSRGCHQLLRDGACLVESVDDVLESLGPLVEPMQQADGTEVHHPAELQLNEVERAILSAIDTEPTPVDTIATTTGLPVHQVLSTLSVLEMRHLIRRPSGSSVVRV